DGSDDRPVSFAIGPYHMSFPSGLRYVQSFAVPNFHFHVTAAYSILRHSGVPLGKGDFLGDMGADVTIA
ncbi:MAG: DUF1993 domain-containing protein, partial [Bacteroidales bacterium]|nr:DUF1993 domain-containing protein [Bacteroidales bacterium]